LIGGFFILFYIFLNDFNIYLKIFSLLIFFTGLFSDLNLLKSPSKRIIIQAFIIFTFLFFTEIKIENIRINFLDQILKHNLLNYMFLTFCIIVIMNGTNFIDGINSNVLIYYLMIFFLIIIFNNKYILFLDKDLIQNFILLLLVLIFLNFNSKLFIGDNGSYLLSFFSSYFLINFYLDNQFISPFFIVLLLWYPGFENLFSIIRKYNAGLSPIKPDTNHLHHLVFKFLKKKYKFKNSNNLSTLLISSFNLIIISVGFLHFSNTQFQIFLIFINVIFYCFIYLRLYKFVNRS
tara:strand:+ start:749 stop:1621 length:873 start_codon:yes stop_codon:yes gene_type:complete